MSHIIAAGEQDRTAELQTVLNEHSRVSFGPGLFVVSELRLQSNQHVSLDPRTVIRRIPGTQPGNVVMHIIQQSNVLLEGGTVDGNSLQGPREQAHAVAVDYSSNVTLRNVVGKNAPTTPEGGSYGDGIYLGHVTRIRMQGCTSLDNDRHGTQINHCIDGLFERCTWASTRVPDPGSGLNLEGADDTFLMQNLTFRDCIFEKCCTEGITANNHFNADWRNILFDSCIIRHNVSDGFAGTGGTSDGGVRFSNCRFESNGANGLYSLTRNGLRVESCRFQDNVEAGLRMDDDHHFTVANCDFLKNGFEGIFLSHRGVAYDGQVFGSRFFNNGQAGASGRQAGLHSQAGYPGETSRLHLIGNRTGNREVYGEAKQDYGFFLEGVGSQECHLSFNTHVGNLLGELNCGGGDNGTSGTHVVLAEP